MKIRFKHLLGAVVSLLATLALTHNTAAEERIAFYAPAVATSTSRKGVTTTTTNNQIFTMAPDGTDVRQLTTGTINCFFPRWDKGQQHLLFFRDRDLCVMDADGSNVFVVAVGTPRAGGDWSATGTQICYEGFDASGSLGLLIVDVNPTAKSARSKVGTPVLIRHGSVWGPDWSPVGDKIAFSSYPDGGTPYITVFDLTTGAETRFDSFPGLDPAWNSTGTQLVFSGKTGVSDTGDSIWELFITNPDWTDMVQLTSLNTLAVWPTFSPDDTELVFRKGGADASLYKLSLSSGAMTLLAVQADGPSWRP